MGGVVRLSGVRRCEWRLAPLGLQRPLTQHLAQHSPLPPTGQRQCLDRVMATGTLDSRRQRLAELACYYSGVRGSLETHIRAEELELWPLFAEHFPVAEQEHLVGLIIGRTGADVLTSLLSWVRGAMTREEEDAMMLSIRSAASSTAFDAWLGAAMGQAMPDTPSGGAGGGAGGEGATPRCGGGAGQAAEMRDTLAEVAGYLSSQGLLGAGAAAEAGAASAESSLYTPGWGDIFRMNQKQLEAAVRRVSSDAGLEPGRKAYLIQHIMASRYVVAQQRLLAGGAGDEGGGRVGGLAGERGGGQGGEAPGEGASASPAAASPPVAGGESSPPPRPPAAGPAAGPLLHSARRYHDPKKGVLGCRHYRRAAQLVAPCCDRAYVCRFCHDEATDHVLDRYAVCEMVCMECSLRQPVAGSCSGCGTCMSRYYCKVCHLFDDDPGKAIYHCPFCNFCRQGKGPGIDSFHCMSCNACMSLELFNKHVCKEQSLKRDCPVCSDMLFESKHPVKELPCGHFMHSHCFAAYTRYAYTCPLCFKSLGNLEMYWRMIDRLLEAEQLPAEYAGRRQSILCNDCGARSEVAFHFVYHRCASCKGYNTRIV
uniref:RING finger and CHY zinc finger domain-containing protein 1 n=1 Tax=Auxenochlorella protothecoides TaxID=3075 RepID=A0A1D2ABG2_AUXPR